MILIEKPRKFDTKAFQGQFLPQTASYHDVLSVRGLQIGYDSVLSKVSFELHRMERIAVIGENGKGKSNTFKNVSWGAAEARRSVFIRDRRGVGIF